jgi:predicted secreted Zn-dependent protease
LFLLIAAGCARAQEAGSPVPGVKLTVSTNFYTVSGVTREELRQHMAALGPRGADGKRRDASADCKMTWDYAYQSANGAFYISSSTVSLDIKFTLPRAFAPKALSAPMASEWNRFITALMVHEAGHSNIAAVGAQKLSRTLAERRTFSTRNQLADFAQNEGQKCLTEMRNQDLVYDQRTEHGLTQGARLHSP